MFSGVIRAKSGTLTWEDCCGIVVYLFCTSFTGSLSNYSPVVIIPVLLTASLIHPLVELTSCRAKPVGFSKNCSDMSETSILVDIQTSDLQFEILPSILGENLP